MKFRSALCLVGLFCSETAFATDLPSKTATYNAPVSGAGYDWTGFYLGTGLGFRAADNRANVNSARNTSVPAVLADRFLASGCYVGLPCVTGQQFNSTSLRISPYVGYNWQINSRWVLGIEADAGFGSQTVRSSGYYPATPFDTGSTTSSNSFSVKTDWDASIRGRVGYLLEPGLMVYATGGPAWLHVEATSNCSTLTSADGNCSIRPGFVGLSPATISRSKAMLGATVGGGLEAMLSPNWFVRGEYRYSDYGSFRNTDVRTSPTGTETVDYDVKIKTHAATLGLAYKFGDPSPTPTSPLSAYGAIENAAPWTGGYVGAGVGVRGSQTTASLVSAVATRQGDSPSNVLDQCECFLDSAMNGTAFRFNPYVGYNWQFSSHWLVGIEGDFGWANQTTTISGGYEPGTFVFRSSGGLNDSYSIATKWDGSLRLRLGYVVNPGLMIYGTAGPAWMKIEEKSRCDTAAQFLHTAPGFSSSDVGECAPGLGTPVDITHSTVRTGFTIGGGGEARLWDHWVARAEYRYSDFGTANFADTRSCAGSVTLRDSSGSLTSNCFEIDDAQRAVRVRTNTAMFGIAYKFD